MVKELKKCLPEYWEFVRELRNNPLVQDGFIDRVQITVEQQQAYMHKYSDLYRVCLVDSAPAGYVGVIEDDIRICTHPSYQKLGVGKFMLENIMLEFPTAYGKVKIENEASINLFESLGFRKSFIIFTK